MPLSDYATAMYENANFENVIAILSRLSLRCQTPAHCRLDVLQRRYNKIQLEKGNITWIIMHSSGLYWTLIHDGTLHKEILKDTQKMMKYWCEYDHLFSRDMARVLLCHWRADFGSTSIATFTLLKDFFNIDDNIRDARFRFIFDTESDPPPGIGDEDEDVYNNLAKKLDVLSIINHLDNVRDCLEFLKFVIGDLMKENEKFRTFASHIRYKIKSRWGVNLDTMIKIVESEFYQKMKIEEPQIIRWKV